MGVGVSDLRGIGGGGSGDGHPEGVGRRDGSCRGVVVGSACVCVLGPTMG